EARSAPSDAAFPARPRAEVHGLLRAPAASQGLQLPGPVAVPDDRRLALCVPPRHALARAEASQARRAARSRRRATAPCGLPRLEAPPAVQHARHLPPLRRAGRLSGVSFPALRQPVFRAYFAGAASLMMADSIEHVISYWIMFQKFHSPALAGFAVISHWVPFLFF